MKRLNNSVYRRNDVLTGMVVYGVGDTIAALLAGDFVLFRLLGMSAVGALLYSAEIPNYFRWVEKVTSRKVQHSVYRTLLAMLYFNPLWVARHLLFIKFFSEGGGFIQEEAFAALYEVFVIALNSFLIAIPITVTVNMLIQNGLVLKYRFIASALFSCAMAVYYPLMSLLV